MKRISVLMITLLCLLALCGCQKEEPIDPMEKLIIEDLASIEIKEIELGQSSDAPVTSRFAYTNYNLFYYDVKIEFTNLSNKEMILEDMMECKIYFEEKSNPTYLTVESEDRTELLDTYTLEADETVLLHVYATYTPTERNIYKDTELVFSFENEEYKMKLNNPDDFTLEKTYIGFDENLTTSENISIDIQECFTEKEIYPSESSSIGYQVPSQNQTFVILKLLVTNNSENQKSMKQLAGYRTVTAERHFTDNAGTILLETSDGKELQQDGILQPGEQSTVYCLAAVSDDKLDDIIELRLDTCDGTYHITK